MIVSEANLVLTCIGSWRALTWGRINPIMGTMAEEKKGRSRGAEEAEEKLKEGLRRIFEATKELSKEVIEGFKEGYSGGKRDK